MKLVATFLVAALMMATGTSLAFGDCAGHNKAQLVKNQGQAQEQMTKEQSAGVGTPFAVAEKAAEQVKPAAKIEVKK